jgi:hypothetical protein
MWLVEGCSSSPAPAADGAIDVVVDGGSVDGGSVDGGRDGGDGGPAGCRGFDGGTCAPGTTCQVGACPDGTPVSCFCDLNGELTQCTGACPPEFDGGNDDGGQRLCDGGIAGDVAGACRAICDKTRECTQSFTPYSDADCTGWCRAFPAAASLSAVADCASCFACSSCSELFLNPLTPYTACSGNPLSCLRACGVGSCNRDSDCSPPDACVCNAGRYSCGHP